MTSPRLIRRIAGTPSQGATMSAILRAAADREARRDAARRRAVAKAVDHERRLADAGRRARAAARLTSSNILELSR